LLQSSNSNYFQFLPVSCVPNSIRRRFWHSGTRAVEAKNIIGRIARIALEDS
jgi:hypothetical protein